MNKETYDKLLYQAKVCVESGRSEETLDYMEQIIKNKKTDLTEEERNLLSVASKNCVSSKRAAWRSIYGIEVREQSTNSKNLHLVSELKQKLEKELLTACKRMLDYLDNYLLKVCNTTEAEVFYLKLKGDYYRYVAEFSTGNNHQEIANNSLQSYKHASEVATGLNCQNPVRLGLALNYSVFYYEVMGNPVEAINIANAAFNDGIDKLNDIVDSQYRDATNILQLLKENINMWTTDLAEEQGEGNEN